VHNGDAEFDAMRGFLRRNGVERVLDEWDFALGTERLGWGVSDEALMRRAVEEMRSMREPFFVGLLSMTNHHPYEVPPRFRRHTDSGEYGRYLDAMTYTDHALGRFFDWAREQPFYRRTVFFVFADTANRQPLPGAPDTLHSMLRQRYGIPLLVVTGWSDASARVSRPTSQVDLPPMVMELLGETARLPWVGTSPLRRDAPARALVHRPGSYWAVVVPDGAMQGRRDDVRWEPNRDGAAPPDDIARWARDALLVNRWAIQHDRVVPPPGRTTAARDAARDGDSP